ncbi:MAG: hypothetical protein JO147_10360 [Actinobacteria bacterium]|nr:hypothetical protein [Actinomycetota bacterium]
MGVYGTGITTLAAIPLPPRTADSLRDELDKAGATTSDNGDVTIGVGALNLLLSVPTSGSWSWLLTGTVTTTTLTQAANELPAVSGSRR